MVYIVQGNMNALLPTQTGADESADMSRSDLLHLGILECMLQTEHAAISFESIPNVVLSVLEHSSTASSQSGTILGIALNANFRFSITTLQFKHVDALQLAVTFVLLAVLDKTEVRNVLNVFGLELLGALEGVIGADNDVTPRDRVLPTEAVLFAAEFLESYRQSESILPSDKAKEALRQIAGSSVGRQRAPVEIALEAALTRLLECTGLPVVRVSQATAAFRQSLGGVDEGLSAFRLLNTLSSSICGSSKPSRLDSALTTLLRSLMGLQTGLVERDYKNHCQCLLGRLRTLRSSLGLQVAARKCERLHCCIFIQTLYDIRLLFTWSLLHAFMETRMYY